MKNALHRGDRVVFRRRLQRLLGLLGAVGVLHALPAAGATVLRTSVAEMLEKSDFVFEGLVLGTRSEVYGQGVRTWVRFEVVDVVKGPNVGSTLELSFMGGEVEGRGERVVGMVIPSPGERGIYFVESLDRLQVNPFFGWDQGRIRILRDTRGRDRVVSARGRPIVDVGSGALRKSLLGAPFVETGEAARGIEVDAGAALEQALTPADLKRALRMEGAVRR